MCKLGQRDERVVAITAAMPDGTGLKRFRNMYPDRFSMLVLQRSMRLRLQPDWQQVA